MSKMSIQDYALQLLEECGRCDIKTNKEIIRLWAYLKGYENKYIGVKAFEEIRSRMSERLVDYIQEQCDLGTVIGSSQDRLNLMMAFVKFGTAMLSENQLKFLAVIIRDCVMPFCQHRVEELHKFIERVEGDDELMSQGGFR